MLIIPSSFEAFARDADLDGLFLLEQVQSHVMLPLLPLLLRVCDCPGALVFWQSLRIIDVVVRMVCQGQHGRSHRKRTSRKGILAVALVYAIISLLVIEAVLGDNVSEWNSPWSCWGCQGDWPELRRAWSRWVTGLFYVVLSVSLLHNSPDQLVLLCPRNLRSRGTPHVECGVPVCR